MALDWDDFKYFAAVARAGSVRGAAKDLGVHPSTVTRRLEHFERRLGTDLFARTAAGLNITAEGQAVMQTLDEVGHRIAEVEQRLQARNSDMAGVVSINVPEMVGAELYVPALGRLLLERPQIRIELTSSWRLPDLRAHEADLALAVTHDPPDHLVGRPVGSMVLAAYARRNAQQRWLTSFLERSLPHYKVPSLAARWPRSDLGPVDAQRVAAFQGIGATLLPCYLAHRYPELEPLTDQRDSIPMWLLSRPEARGVARVHAVADTLATALREHDLGFADASPRD